MARRVKLPGASELFRPTDTGVDVGPAAVASDGKPSAEASAPAAKRRPRTVPDEGSAATGRVRHDEKITVYVSAEELLALEHSRLVLRGEHRLAVDRGRIVRAAIAAALDDLSAHGEDSDLIRRLREQ